MADLLDELDETVVPEVVALEPAKTAAMSRREAKDEALREMEDELLQENMAIIRDVAKFRDIDPSSDEIPMEWIAELGMEEAQKRHRIAKAAWCNAKEAPVGLAIAKSIMVGIVKARATEKGPPRALNIGVAVNMPVPGFDRKVIEVDE